jgi:hypothetical protein
MDELFVENVLDCTINCSSKSFNELVFFVSFPLELIQVNQSYLLPN